MTQLAGRLAGRRHAAFDGPQIAYVVSALERPEPVAQTAANRPRRNAPLAYAATAVEQPSVLPVFAFADALLRHASELCDPVHGPRERDEALTCLRRAGLTMRATRNAIDTYDRYTRTPGHEKINSSQAALRKQGEVVEARIHTVHGPVGRAPGPQGSSGRATPEST